MGSTSISGLGNVDFAPVKIYPDAVQASSSPTMDDTSTTFDSDTHTFDED